MGRPDPARAAAAPVPALRRARREWARPLRRLRTRFSSQRRLLPALCAAAEDARAALRRMRRARTAVRGGMGAVPLCASARSARSAVQVSRRPCGGARAHGAHDRAGQRGNAAAAGGDRDGSAARVASARARLQPGIRARQTARACARHSGRAHPPAARASHAGPDRARCRFTAPQPAPRIRRVRRIQDAGTCRAVRRRHDDRSDVARVRARAPPRGRRARGRLGARARAAATQVNGFRSRRARSRVP